MINMETLFQFAIGLLKEDMANNPNPSIVREVFIKNNQLTWLFGNFKKEELSEVLKELVSYRYVGEMYGNVYGTYTNVCPAFRLTKEGVVLHMYPMATQFARK